MNGDEREDKKGKIKEKLDLFAHRVTVTGLREAHVSSVFERITFSISLILASAAVICFSYNFILSYFAKESMYGDLDVPGIQAPFPTVTVCGPDAVKPEVINQLATSEFTIQKWHAILQKYNMTPDEAVEIIASFASFAVYSRTNQITSSKIREVVKFGGDIMAPLPHGVSSYINMVHPNCQDMFSTCIFERRQFNCCDAVQHVISDNTVCYQFNLNDVAELGRFDPIKGGAVNDPTRMEKSGLSVEVKINWSQVLYWDGAASDGFHVVIGPTMSPWAVPVAIPAGMDAIITLAQARKFEELTACRIDVNSGYDPYGDVCMGKEITRSVESVMGCTGPLSLQLERHRDQVFCTAEQLDALRKIVDGSVFAGVDASTLRTKTSTDYEKKERLLRDFGKSVFSNCLPLCTRFVYSVLSASYGSFHHVDQDTWDEERRNQSWSRIRVFFPIASYRLHKEKYTSPGYVAVSKVGGVMGVYLGLSMITLVQIVIYGVLVCVQCWKGKRSIIMLFR